MSSHMGTLEWAAIVGGLLIAAVLVAALVAALHGLNQLLELVQ